MRWALLFGSSPVSSEIALYRHLLSCEPRNRMHHSSAASYARSPKRSFLSRKLFSFGNGRSDDGNELCANFIALAPSHRARAFLDNPIVGKEKHKFIRNVQPLYIQPNAAAGHVDNDAVSRKLVASELNLRRAAVVTAQRPASQLMHNRPLQTLPSWSNHVAAGNCGWAKAQARIFLKLRIFAAFSVGRLPPATTKIQTIG
jgi:hypothetical protein